MKIAILLLTLFPLTQFSCDEDMKHKLLLMFFDGVEEEITIQEEARFELVAVDTSQEAVAANSTDTLTQAVVRTLHKNPEIFYHKPYQERKCGDCHAGQFGNKLVSDASELCYNCHPEFKELKGFIHGPVAVGGCSACHAPHTAKRQFLLTRPGDTICTFCHTTTKVTLEGDHSKIGELACTECHTPHSSETSKFYVKS